MGYTRVEETKSYQEIQPWYQEYGAGLREQLADIQALEIPWEEKRASILETKTKLFEETTTPEFRTAHEAQIAADQARLEKQLKEHDERMALNKTLAIAATATVGGLILLPAILGTAPATVVPAATTTEAAVAPTAGALSGIAGAASGLSGLVTTGALALAATGKKAIDSIREIIEGGSTILSERAVPPEATPPLVEMGTISEAAGPNWALLGLLGVGAYLLLKGR